MLELSNNRLRVFTGFLIRHCCIGKHMARLGLQENSNCKFSGTEDENLELLTSNCITTTKIHANHLT